MKSTKILKVWNNIKFKLYVPEKIDKNNKIEVHFSYLNPVTGKNKYLKKSTGIDRHATKKVYTQQANDLIETLIECIIGGWDPISDTYPDYVKLNSQSNINESIKMWLKVRQMDQENGLISTDEIKVTGFLFSLFSAFLKQNHMLAYKPEQFTCNDINFFMRTHEKLKGWSPVTYNSYLYRLSFFFKFLYDERIITFNPCTPAHKYKTRNLKTRYNIFEQADLKLVKKHLTEDSKFQDLYIASKFLFEYNIREAEQLRIKLSWIDWERGELTFPEKVEERGRMVGGTKNGLGAKFRLREDMLLLLKGYIGTKDGVDNYLIGGNNRPGPGQRGKQFLSNRWWKFRETYDISKNLKLYALKHTGNYESLETVGIEKLSQMARHSNISQTQDYVKSKLNKQIITIDGKVGF
ncbi:MAG: hypothetical protein EOO90_25915 [Pedobacter sp.]|nr:MAG: hypothetical protein EOO90_25915 [Pedobacter sp.]